MNSTPASPLELREVSGACSDGTGVSGISTSFCAGRLHLLRGGSDGGKTALFRFLGLLEKPATGDVLIHGSATGDLSEELRTELRTQRFGFVFTAPFLLSSFSVIENVAMPLFKISRVDPEEARRRTETLLNFVGLGGAAEAVVDELSLSAQYQAAFARGLINEPAVLLIENLDGVLSGTELDEYMQLLRKAAAAFGTAIIATTSLELKPQASDRVLDVIDGAIAGFGISAGDLRMTTRSAEAQAITRASKSNLALAFVSLPRERRDDITTFYAWCRVIDDIADDPGQSVEQRKAALDLWRQALRQSTPGESTLAAPVRILAEKYGLKVGHFDEIIAGVEMDLTGASYETWEDLRLYCHRVASVVGLISIEIFGCRDPLAVEYAEQLGLALQLTNILRDVGEDFANGGRIYLPRQDLARFHYTVEDLAAQRHNEAFLALMRFEAARAREFYAAAVNAMPPKDRRALVAAEIMRAIYRRLLERMDSDDFHVFHQRYSLGRWKKLGLIASAVLRAKFV